MAAGAAFVSSLALVRRPHRRWGTACRSVRRGWLGMQQQRRESSKRREERHVPRPPSVAPSGVGGARAPLQQRQQQQDENAAEAEASEGGERCGFVALLGPSNTGKSTLLNALVGGKVAIVSPKVQTTRCRVTGIVVERSTNAQLVFLDTPGIFSARRRLDRAMVRAAWASCAGADVVALVLDAHKFRRLGGKLDELERGIVEALRERRAKGALRARTLLAVNKIDLIGTAHKEDLVEEMQRAVSLSEYGGADETLVVSALHGLGVDAMRQRLGELMPRGPWLYPEDDMSDMPLRLLAAETTREQLFRQLRDELPYEAAVETTRWQELPDGSVVVEQEVVVQRDSQRIIVTGAGGQQIKKISMRAREDLANTIGATVHLYLRVKCRPKWDEKPSQFKRWGLEYDA